MKKSKKHDRDVYGKVESPVQLIQEIYSLLPLEPNLRIYEPGIGTNLFQKNYPTTYKSYSGCEIQPTCELPPEIFIGDFFEHCLEEYDLIVGNPPFRVETNCPSTSPIATKPTQKTIWPDIVKRCWEHLAPGGRLAMILPCIWLKPDKAGIYSLFTSHCIEYLKTFDSAESNKLFQYNGQTPSCYVIVRKCEPNSSFKIWDKNDFIDFKLKPGYCIPTKNAQLLGEIQEKIKESLKVIKVATLVPEGNIVDNPINQYPILLGASYINQQLVFNGLEHSEPGPYQSIPKIILAHKRLPIPFLDISGTYGIHGRDKYIILADTIEELQETYKFLLTPLAQTIIKSFTIRMNYYEKQVFDYLPKNMNSI